MDLLGRYSSQVNGIARPDFVGVEYRFRDTPHNTTSGNTIKNFLERSNGWIYSYGPFVPVLWSCRWNSPNGRRRSAAPITRYST